MAQRGRPASPKTGKDAIGVKLLRGKNKDVLFWISDAMRFAPPGMRTPVWHYVWKSKCTTCGKSHAQTLQTSYLEIKQGKEIKYRIRCAPCRGEAGAGKAVGVVPVASATDVALANRMLTALTVDTPDNREYVKWLSAANWDEAFKALVRSTIASVKCEYMTEQFISELAKNG